MTIGLKMTLTAGLLAGALGLCTSASAMPVLAGPALGGAVIDSTAPKAEKVWCNVYGCHHRYYRNYYRPYGYGAPYGGYYRPYGYGYGYGPHIGIGIGGVGLGLY